jgi:hypothetical protein
LKTEITQCKERVKEPELTTSMYATTDIAWWMSIHFIFVQMLGLFWILHTSALVTLREHYYSRLPLIIIASKCVLIHSGLIATSLPLKDHQQMLPTVVEG